MYISVGYYEQVLETTDTSNTWDHMEGTFQVCRSSSDKSLGNKLSITKYEIRFLHKITDLSF